MPLSRPAAILALLLAPAPLLAEGAAHDGAHWSYEGETGPEAWASLDPANAACATGTQQSPIDLAGAIKGEVGALRRDWAPGASWVAVNNGHTIQFNLAEGSEGGGLEIGNRRYELAQFHFHHPSEHAVDAAHSDMEVHFVHKAEDGALAVIGVMLTGGGGPGLLDALFQVAPAVEGEAPAGAADPSSLLPTEGGFYRYEGSLTTPPCTESVTWTVMTQPVAVSDQVVAAFATVFPNDARPIQPLNRRYLLLN
ncbi:carbonic anhydrase [Rubellimicrobium aerolatum]|uniref:carbonic anhydrase n=1 Tax=Rubellimicrobium aerolatum TaxID=490979 RepID=A0ABW0SDH8_9RHOB|nr:carbonic anhydrase family protein [Rubellimicrobium aerolatum]MBP1805786.1 carbonic anhydrase [Rubellimicrobium aerolatum]